ncbi:MAG TPA: hypothetical protein V6C65_07770 [Allocoleopsis sp.]
MKHIKMPKELATKWLDALRSGKYNQTRGKLHNTENNSFCCLGVLQHCISGVTIKIDRDVELPSPGWLQSHGITFSSECGEISSDPYITSEGVCISSVNDEGNSFTIIADLLEQEMEFTDEDNTK